MNIVWILIGLSIGSFLNGLAFRATSNKPLFSKRSICSSCNKKIAWYDLIPVFSWFLLRGKCRNCDRKIPFNYTSVELFVGLITYLFFKDAEISLLLLVQYGFVISFFLNVITDATCFVVYDPFLYVMVSFATAFAFFNGAFIDSFLSGVVVLMIIATVSLVVSFFVKKQAMGSGDFFIFFALGIILSPSEILNLLLFASLTGILVSLVFRRKELPFFPLLFFGYIFVLYGGRII